MGIESALKESGRHGYEAMMLVIGVIALATFSGFIIKWILRSTEKREERLAQRISDLENFVERTLLDLVKHNTELMAKIMDSLNAMTKSFESRTCLMDTGISDRIVDRFADRVGEKVVTRERKNP